MRFDQQFESCYAEDGRPSWRLATKYGEGSALTTGYMPRRLNDVVVDSAVTGINLGQEGISAGSGIAVMSMPSVAAASFTGREPLNGYFDCRIQDQQNNTNIQTFQISSGYSLENNFTFPLPSSNGDDISELRLLTGVTVSVDEVGLPDGTSYYVFWTPSEGFTPSDGIQGDFDWLGDDQVTRYFRVTFTQRPEEDN